MTDVSETKQDVSTDRESTTYTVGTIARMVNVSVRTLHHYDQIGLVVPSQRSTSGYREYTDADVERLHRVLTYREVGFALEQIATLLDDPTSDPVAHLRAQRDLLTDRIDRLHRMVVAVEDMMNAKKQGIQLTAAEQAEIFGDNWTGDEYAAEAEQRWGDTDAWQQSQQRTAQYTKDDWKQIKEAADQLESDVAQAMSDGIAPGSREANALAERHRDSINRFYDCGHEMQVCVAQTYISDPRFTAHYEGVASGLAQYLHDIIVANAEQHR